MPRCPLDLTSTPDPSRFHGTAVDFVEDLTRIHGQTRDNLIASSSAYKERVDKHRRNEQFEVGDFVWAVLTKDRFAVREYNKLKPRKIGPVEIIEKINANAYRLQLPDHLRTANVFNIKHLFRHEPEDVDLPADSGSNLFQEEGPDAA